ncbi:4Fe-4S binding protein [bacterium]|nr:4Fe-4S binding protein [bacterium]
MKKLMIFRFTLLILITLVTGLGIFLTRMNYLKVNPHVLCPYSFICFGIPALQGFFSRNPVIIGSIVGAIILLLTPVLGRWFCGWLCPLGAIQEIFYKLTNGKSKGKVKPLISDNWDKRLKLIKYFVLLGNIFFAYFLIQALYMKACPLVALANLGNYLLVSSIVFFIIMISSLFVERIWCRYFCPYGALMSLLLLLGNLLRIPRIMLKVNKSMCVDCGLCSANCPMQIKVEDKNQVSNSECILCQRCKAKCPRQGIDCEFCNKGGKDE